MYEEIFQRPACHTPDLVGRSDEPWLTREAITILNEYLKPNMVCAEFGTGSSTIWFAKRVAKLYSVENDIVYAEKVKKILPNNVDYRVKTDFTQYIFALLDVPNESLDMVLIDGMEPRALCAAINLGKVKPGALFVVDNMDRGPYSPILDMTLCWELKKTVGSDVHTYIWKRPK